MSACYCILCRISWSRSTAIPSQSLFTVCLEMLCVRLMRVCYILTAKPLATIPAQETTSLLITQPTLIYLYHRPVQFAGSPGQITKQEAVAPSVGHITIQSLPQPSMVLSQ